MKVIIAGSRDFNDYEALKQYCDKVLANTVDIEIVSGKARGADALGELYAKECGYKITEFPADWEKYGKRSRTYKEQTNGRLRRCVDCLLGREKPGNKEYDRTGDQTRTESKNL